MTSLEAIALAVKNIGGPSILAAKFAISASAVSQWTMGVRPTPQDRCPGIERATEGRVTCEELRPDVRWQRVPDPHWPHPNGRPCIDVASAVEGA